MAVADLPDDPLSDLYPCDPALTAAMERIGLAVKKHFGDAQSGVRQVERPSRRQVRAGAALISPIQSAGRPTKLSQSQSTTSGSKVMPDGNSKPTISVTSWRPLVKNTLRGFCDIHFPMGLTIKDVTVHTKGDRSWVSLPAKPQLTAEGEVKRNAGGKAEYNAILTWDSREIGDRFSEKVVALIEEEWPGALQ